MHPPSSTQQEQLQALVRKQSKHSDYQTLHPWISPLVSETAYQPSGKAEAQRQAYMCAHYDFSKKRLLDIGANTGYFSFAALQAGAAHVQAYEGNPEHAAFMIQAATIIGLKDQLSVCSAYFDFSPNPEIQKSFNVGLCLNVLHHLGDDFGDSELNVYEAKRAISIGLQSLASSCQTLWFQIGFNWQGNRDAPLFKTGSKEELIEFIQISCASYWTIENIGIFNPNTQKYKTMTQSLLARFDTAGEFLNRPIFLLKSNKI